MIEFEKPNIKCLEMDNNTNYAKFTCEPLERGYGITIGNSLRRILLSSLPGAAITSVKIDGAAHEFTTIPNVVEDVPEIIVNLKMVRIKIVDDEPKTLRINFQGEGEVTAANIETDGSVEILNPDLHIARWTSNNGNDSKSWQRIQQCRKEQNTGYANRSYSNRFYIYTCKESKLCSREY